MKIRDIFDLPEPKRTKLLEDLSETQAIMVYSKEAFPVRFRGKIEHVKAGENAVSKNFGIYLLRKYPKLSETPSNGTKTDTGNTHSPYFDKLLAINGIAETTASKIVAEFPTSAELLEAVKADRLPDGLKKYKDAFLEVF